jgi:hypothetical protein
LWGGHERWPSHLAVRGTLASEAEVLRIVGLGVLDDDDLAVETLEPGQRIDEYGRLLQRAHRALQLLGELLGNREAGVAALERAAELAPDDPEILGAFMDGLYEVGRAEEVRRALASP